MSKCSQDILAWAAWLAGEYQASLGIVHATAATDVLDAEHYRSVSAQAGARIDVLQATVGTAAEVFINSGKPNKMVGRAAEEFAADLLVIGRHESVGVVGNLFQNALAILRGSRCPVISI